MHTILDYYVEMIAKKNECDSFSLQVALKYQEIAYRVRSRIQ